MIQVNIIGNLGADVREVRHQSSVFYSLSVGCSHRWTDASGNRVEVTEWVNVAINWRIDNIRPYLTKGQKIFVSGRGKLRVFKDRSGQYRAGLDITADLVELCGMRATQVVEQTSDENIAPY